jgi:hypothetical protein
LIETLKLSNRFALAAMSLQRAQKFSPVPHRGSHRPSASGSQKHNLKLQINHILTEKRQSKVAVYPNPHQRKASVPVRIDQLPKTDHKRSSHGADRE